MEAKNEFSAENNKNNVILQLWGIETKWVRSTKGEWVDQNSLIELPTDTTNTESETMDNSSETRKKWWQFWK